MPFRMDISTDPEGQELIESEAGICPDELGIWLDIWAVALLANNPKRTLESTRSNFMFVAGLVRHKPPPLPLQKNCSPPNFFQVPFSGGGDFLGGDPAEAEAAGAGVVVAAPAGAPADVGAHAAHGVQQVEHAAFADTEAFGYLAGGAAAALADELIQAFNPVVAVVEGHGGECLQMLSAGLCTQR